MPIRTCKNEDRAALLNVGRHLPVVDERHRTKLTDQFVEGRLSPNQLLQVCKIDKSYYFSAQTLIKLMGNNAPWISVVSQPGLDKIKHQLTRTYLSRVILPVLRSDNIPTRNEDAPIKPLKVDGAVTTAEELFLWYTILNLMKTKLDDAISKHSISGSDLPAQNTNSHATTKFYKWQISVFRLLEDFYKGQDFQAASRGDLINLISIIEFISDGVEPVFLHLLNYANKELKAFVDNKKSTFLSIHPEKRLTDIRRESSFRSFVRNTRILPEDLFDRLNAIPFDFVKGGVGSPVLLVFLDNNHSDVGEKLGVLADWARLYSLSPTYTFESHPFNKAINSNVRGRTLPNACQDKNFENRRRAFDEVVKSYLTTYDRQGAIVDGNDCLYRGTMTFLGFSDPTVLVIGRKYNYHQIIDGDGMTSLVANLIVMLRSEKSYDNSLLIVNQNSKTIGAINIGANHYPTMRAHAAKKRKAHVVFLRAAPQKGPMPKIK